MKLTNRQVVITELLIAAAYALLFVFPIAAFPSSYSKSVSAFHLPNEHKLITYSEYSSYVWITGALLPLMAVSLSSVRHTYGLFVMLLVSFLIFLIVYPQAYSFGTDAKPMNFDTHPSWSVYMAVYVPPVVTLVQKIRQFKLAIAEK